MSYKRPNTGNSMNDYFTSLFDFVSLSDNLLTAKDSHEFEIWLEKLEEVDKRALYLFLKKNKDKISEDYMDLAKRRFKDLEL